MRSRAEASQQARAFADNAVREHHAALQSFLLRRLANREDVGDMVQEVYLRLLRLSDTDAIRDPLPYIYGIAGHVASEFNQRNRRGRVVFDSEQADCAGEQHEWASSVEGGAYFERQASQALSALPQTRLAVLVLERRDGLSHAQIAEKLGLSIHTVKKYSVEALAHVRASLDR